MKKLDDMTFKELKAYVEEEEARLEEEEERLKYIEYGELKHDLYRLEDLQSLLTRNYYYNSYVTKEDLENCIKTMKEELMEKIEGKKPALPKGSKFYFDGYEWCFERSSCYRFPWSWSEKYLENIKPLERTDEL